MTEPGADLYHPYYDRKFFCYEITIYREEGERYIMTVSSFLV